MQKTQKPTVMPWDSLSGSLKITTQVQNFQLANTCLKWEHKTSDLSIRRIKMSLTFHYNFLLLQSADSTSQGGEASAPLSELMDMKIVFEMWQGAAGHLKFMFQFICLSTATPPSVSQKGHSRSVMLNFKKINFKTFWYGIFSNIFSSTCRCWKYQVHFRFHYLFNHLQAP